MSSASLVCILVLLHLLFSSPLDMVIAVATAGYGQDSPPHVSTQTLVAESRDYATVKPQLNHKRKVFGGRQVKNCLPKGLRHSSAPSRYVNYHTLGSARCSSSRTRSRKSQP